MRFQDRQDGGRQLARRLLRFQAEAPIVLALPRGGVVVGFEVASALGAPFDVIVARKLGAPGNPEFGIGAIAPGGVRVVDPDAIRGLGITADVLEEVTAQESIELDRRLKLYRGDRPPVHVTDRTILLIDDGLATGVTARAAILSIRQQNPMRLVLAVPVSAPETALVIEPLVDEFICLQVPPEFKAVGQFYLHFVQTGDDEVLRLLARAPAVGSGSAGSLPGAAW